MKKYFWTYHLYLMVIVLSCKTVHTKTPVVEEVKIESLQNTRWQLADETGTKLPTLWIENDKIKGNATCNRYTAELEMNSGGVFIVKNIATTRIACKKDTEKHYLGLLKKATRYKATQKTLELYQNELLLLKFNKIP